MENINQDTYIHKRNDIIKIFKTAYKKTPTSKIKFDKLSIKKPNSKTEIINVSDYKRLHDLLSSIFANINIKQFTQKRYNPYAFEILWLILDILNPKQKEIFKKRKDIFTNLKLYNSNVAALIKFGKYIFHIPKYKYFIFDVKGYGLAQLTIK